MASLSPAQAFQLALQHHQAGRLQKAAQIYRQILQINAQHADAVHYLGLIAYQTGHHSQAVELMRKSLALDPSVASYFCNLGVVYLAMGQLDQAIGQFRRATQLDPTLVEAHSNLCQLLVDQGDLEAAIHHGQQAIQLTPHLGEAHSNLGHALRLSGQLQQAIHHFQQAISWKPDLVGAYRSLGNTLRELDRPQEAIAYYQQALILKPDFVEVHCGLGMAWRQIGEIDQALHCFDQALALDPHYSPARYNRSLVLMLQGDLQRGFVEYESRWQQKDAQPRPFPYPTWEGSSLQGQTILLWGEQGVGTQIMVSSLIPEVIASSAHCVIECQQRLVPLFARSFPQAEVIPGSLPVDARALQPEIQVQSATMSLVRWLRPSWDHFPQHQGYLTADPELTRRCRQRYRAGGDGAIVGISWRSSTQRKRFPALAEWQPILTCPNIVLINLQYGDCSAELSWIRHEWGVTVHQDATVDPWQSLDDFAAQVAAMDLVISISNTTVHMAGALGIPVWLILPQVPEASWWMVDREDSPWYPSMRIFRQPDRADWSNVVRRVAEQLQARTLVFPPEAVG